MPLMQVLADQTLVTELIEQLCGQIEATKATSAPADAWAIIGLRSGGDVLAKRFAKQLSIETVGTLDITLYRDDLSDVRSQPVVRTTEIPFALDGLNIVMVDDVLMTGRSVRAALNLLMDLGRPRRVWLAVLVDRGGRELPIAADYVGLDLSDKVGELDLVDVRLSPAHPEDQIILQPAPNAQHEIGNST
jgi:pyrimidine operon attenuation protein/uracil phosphoribosyltransferase